MNNGAPNEVDKSGPSAEDLDSVLGRFQDWTKARQARQPATFGAMAGTGRDAEYKNANLGSGARELSYEQALRASSYRRPAYSEPPKARNPHTPANPDAGRSETNARAAPQDPTPAPTPIPTPGPVAAETAAVTPAAAARPDFWSMKVSQPEPLAEPAINPAGVRASPASPTLIPAGMEGRAAIAWTARRNRARGWAEKFAMSPRKDSPSPGLEPTLLDVAQAPGPAMGNSNLPSKPALQPPAYREVPVFREVLEASAGLATAVNIEAVQKSRSGALSLSVSDAEKARIQAGAARANLSVSAYLRQCALGVDDLRDQVELALAKLRGQDTAPAGPPGIAAIPGILGRFASQWLRRFRASSDFTSISLR
jgi:hypothetical protein